MPSASSRGCTSISSSATAGERLALGRTSQRRISGTSVSTIREGPTCFSGHGIVRRKLTIPKSRLRHVRVYLNNAVFNCSSAGPPSVRDYVHGLAGLESPFQQPASVHVSPQRQLQ